MPSSRLNVIPLEGWQSGQKSSGLELLIGEAACLWPTVGETTAPSWLTIDSLFEQCGSRAESAWERYRTVVAERA